MRALILILTVAGLIGAAAIVGWVGVAPVWTAMRGIGFAGFALFCLWSVAVLVVLGGAWIAVAPASGAALGDFVWARTVREAATDVLPFSQLGGLVVGGRALAARGVDEPLVYASMVADLTTEMASQLVFTLAGIAVLALWLGGDADAAGTLPAALAGLALMVVVAAAFVASQRRAVALAGRLAERLLPGLALSMAAFETALAECYRDRIRVLLSFSFNLLAWLLSAGGAWLALRLIGVELPLVAVLAIEALIFAIRSIAFVIPGAIGVQESAYAVIGPVFGLDPQTAVALSLLKRARDLAIGVPALLLWQALEGRTLLRRRA